jgi:hypothetical protein
MDPEMADVLNMRKEANAARDGATNQYEADVADFKNTQATEAEQGIASLPEATESATYMNNQAQAPSTETRFTDNPYVNAFKGKFPIGSDGEPIFEDVYDYTGMFRTCVMNLEALLIQEIQEKVLWFLLCLQPQTLMQMFSIHLNLFMILM